MRRNTLVSTAVIVFLASLLSGCSWMTNAFQSQLEANITQAQFDFVRTKVGAFASCMGNWGGTCDARTEAVEPGEFVQPVKIFRELFHGSEASMVPELSDLVKQPTVSPAVRVFESPEYQKFVEIFNFIRGQSANELSTAKSDGEAPVFQYKRQDLLDFSKDIGDAVRFDAFQAIYAAADRAIKRLKSKTLLSETEKSQLAKLKTIEKTVAYVASYMKAYFRDGEFASIVLDPAGLKTAIADKLKTSFPELKLDAEQLDKLAKKLAGGLPTNDAGNFRLIGKVSESSFTTRGGANYKFPAITVTLNPGTREFITFSKVDFVPVGADLIRVFLEAVGDALAGVPGVTDATGCKIKTDLRLHVFEPDNQATKLKMEEFGNVNDYANKVEGVVSSVTGRVIRGASWFSLNNESIAVLIETALGVIAKKVSEKVIWCGYCVAHKEGTNLTERDPNGIITIVPHGIGRRVGETTVSVKFEIVGGKGSTK